MAFWKLSFIMLTVQALIWQCHHFSVLGKILEANGTSYNCRQILVHANPYRSYMSQAMSSRESQGTPITSFHKWAKEAKIWKALNFGQQQFTRSRNLSLVSIVSINIEHWQTEFYMAKTVKTSLAQIPSAALKWHSESLTLYLCTFGWRHFVPL